MPKKSQKKSAKLSSMTEEERLLYLQKKALAEEEMSKKKEEMLTQFLKDKLAKEERNSKLNLNKLTQQWRVLMREAKARELKKDIEILSQTFERVVDRKDSIIKSLVQDLEEAQDQYAMAIRAHLHNLDHLFELQRGRLHSLWELYCAEEEDLKKQFSTERELIITQHQTEISRLEDICFAMELNYTDRENELRQEFHSTRDDIKNKNIEEKHSLRILLEGRVEDLWQQFQQAQRSYTEATEDRRIAFETLKAKDEKSAKEIDMQMKKIQRIQDSIAGLRNQMSTNARESEEQIRCLKEQKERFQQQSGGVKAEMNQIRASGKKQLVQLTLQSSATAKKLNHIMSKGERIVKLADMCRKLETEEEKVLPFYNSSLGLEERSQVESVAAQPAVEPLAQALKDYATMEKFWQRYNKVQLDQLALDCEKRRLFQENSQLRLLLKQYLDGISVSDEILTELNPLFIVNHRTNVRAEPVAVPVIENRVARPSHNIIEAAHIVQRTI
ncbi:dynein regulatory complex subunit 2 [Erpetoichthys calabaricus]|uniref:dynein regulatory complex subunit 2 n=1 Tax=Erpetoichthys calabaricus TaxID=27687 RepID=UPI0022345EC0|nr:dynein regulatory complex subunit 2 [Erpetoichthys calabaricus]